MYFKGFGAAVNHHSVAASCRITLRPPVVVGVSLRQRSRSCRRRCWTWRVIRATSVRRSVTSPATRSRCCSRHRTTRYDVDCVVSTPTSVAYSGFRFFFLGGGCINVTIGSFFKTYQNYNRACLVGVYVRPPTFLILNNLCDLVYQAPTESYATRVRFR